MTGWGIRTIEDLLQLFLKHRHTGSRTDGARVDQSALDDLDALILVAPDGGRWRLTVDNDGITQTVKQ